MLHNNQYANRSIDSTKLVLGTLTDENISESAAISHSKLNISWRKTVYTVEDLPVNGTDGDTRVVLQNKHLYVYNSGVWKQETGRESYPIWLWSEDEKIYYLLNNVGIGTSNPTEKLHVNGNLNISNENNSVIFSISDTNLTLNNFFSINKLNRIGINTSTPTKLFDVRGESYLQSIFSDEINISSGKIYFEENKLKISSSSIEITDGITPSIDISDNITVYKDMIISSGANFIIDSDLLPVSNNRNIGSQSNIWSNGYFGSINSPIISLASDMTFTKMVNFINLNTKLAASALQSDIINFGDEFSMSRTNKELDLVMSDVDDIFVIKNSVEELVRVNKDQFIINKSLLVRGNMTYVESNNTTVSDDEFIIKKTTPPLDGNASFIVNRANGDAKITWDDSIDRWMLQYGQSSDVISKIFTFKDLDYNVSMNGSISIGTTNSTAKISIATSTSKEIEFIGLENADIYSSSKLALTSENEISISTGGNINQLYVDKLGNVGLNVIPTYKLDINSTQDQILRFSRSGSSVEKKFELNSSGLSMYNGSSLELNISSSGAIGIGKISEGEKLEIFGNVKMKNSLLFKDNGYKNIQMLNSTGLTEWNVGQLSDKSFEIRDEVSSRLYISALNKNVGIGNNNPYYALDVFGGASFATAATNNDFIVSDTSKGNIQRVLWYEFASGRTYIGNLNASGSYAEVYTRGSSFIDKNLGVGKEPGSAKLRVYKPSRYSSFADISTSIINHALVIDTSFGENMFQPGIVWTTSGSNDDIPKAGIWTKTSSSSVKLIMGTSKTQTAGLSGSTLVVHSDSRVGINNENPSEELDVNGNVKANLYKVGTNSGINQSFTFITDVQLSGGVVQKKTKTMTVTGGIVTNISAETGWA